MSPVADPTIEPMLARLARELPSDGYLYEPKWDGFRALVFRDGGTINLRSRHQRPLARYFPEIVEALAVLPTLAFVGSVRRRRRRSSRSTSSPSMAWICARSRFTCVEPRSRGCWLTL